jgi:hypothetical protein
VPDVVGVDLGRGALLAVGAEVLIERLPSTTTGCPLCSDAATLAARALKTMTE